MMDFKVNGRSVTRFQYKSIFLRASSSRDDDSDRFDKIILYTKHYLEEKGKTSGEDENNVTAEDLETIKSRVGVDDGSYPDLCIAVDSRKRAHYLPETKTAGSIVWTNQFYLHDIDPEAKELGREATLRDPDEDEDEEEEDEEEEDEDEEEEDDEGVNGRIIRANWYSGDPDQSKYWQGDGTYKDELEELGKEGNDVFAAVRALRSLLGYYHDLYNNGFDNFEDLVWSPGSKEFTLPDATTYPYLRRVVVGTLNPTLYSLREWSVLIDEALDEIIPAAYTTLKY